MTEVFILPASATQLIASASVFGREIPKALVYSPLARFLGFFGVKVVYGGLDDATKQWLDVVAGMYARTLIQSFESTAIFLAGRGDVVRSARAAELMKDYLMRRLVPKELIFSGVSSKRLRGNLDQFVGEIRQRDDEERLLKLILVANRQTVDGMNRILRRIVPMASFGLVGFFKDTETKVFFLSCPVVSPKSRTLVEKVFPSLWLTRAAYLIARVSPGMRKWAVRAIGGLSFKDEYWENSIFWEYSGVVIHRIPLAQPGAFGSTILADSR
jgi:hypothetical protein